MPAAIAASWTCPPWPTAWPSSHKARPLAAQLRQTAVNFAPGEKMTYCNGGYHLLSLVIEKVAGMPFEQFLQQRILAPLGMQDTASVPSDFEIHAGLACLYVPRAPEQGGGWRRGIFPTEELRGEGAMISTLDDMFTWLAHLRAEKKTVGSEASWQQMMTRTTLNNGLVNPYGLGLMLHDYRGIDVIQHSGGVVGGTCQMITVPGQALDIIIMSNGAPANPIELGNRIIDIMLGDALLGMAKEQAAAARFTPMLGARYHASASGLVCGFAETPEGRLGLTFLDGLPVPLTQDGDVLRVDFEDMAIGPLALQSAALAVENQPLPSTLAISEAGHVEYYERLPVTAPPLAEVAPALLGRYHASDLQAEALLRFDGAQLLLEVSGPYGGDVMVLEAFSDLVFGLRFGGEYPPLRGVLSVERSAGSITALRVNTPRTRNLRFERMAG
ncbi:serine hydrolase [Janthinobacterium lividum]|nr:serine hydrolase [Janthinobacterium lividum]